jgi:nitrogen fixation/metabolism regulation signal transduction histidine kinase
MASEPSHERRVFLLALLAGLPGSALALVLLWMAEWDTPLRISLGLIVLLAWVAFAQTVRGQVARSLLTLANMLGAVREGDFSVRGRGASSPDAFGLAMREINELTETLQEQRLGALEATALLRRVLTEVEVAIFAFDGERKLRVVNRHGERLLGRAAEHVVGSMLVLSDASRALREEEDEAWRRLVRVLSHEINNSLAPISSVAESLEQLLGREPRPSDWEEDLLTGLQVIAGRSDGLRRIMASYARLARLPPPRRGPVDVGAWVRRIAGLETRLGVEVVPGPDKVIQADGDQLDQLLINLIGNASDAALEAGGGVRTGWYGKEDAVVVWVEDEGHGLVDSQNLFVPFFTTKPEGSGIGLALSRQIAEGHAGRLTVRNRTDRAGCRAELWLPFDEG